MSSHPFIRRLAVVGFVACLVGLPSGAAAQGRISGSLLGLYTHAPTLEYDGRELSGAFYSVGGELVLNDRFVGRAQIDVLSTGSLSGSGAANATGGLGIIGSLGYRLNFSALPALSLDLLGHGGYAQVTYENGSEFTDASPQFGFGIAPHLSFGERLALTMSLRILNGADVGEGTAINRTDVGIGGRLTVF